MLERIVLKDDLIDQAFYRLYGLTDEVIRIAEENGVYPVSIRT